MQGWAEPSAGLDILENRKLLPLLGIAQRHLAHPAHTLVTTPNMPFQLLITVKILHSTNQFTCITQLKAIIFVQ
jgi:hypothetical protein